MAVRYKTLVDRQIQELLNSGRVKLVGQGFQEDDVQPSSLDLRLPEEGYISWHRRMPIGIPVSDLTRGKPKLDLTSMDTSDLEGRILEGKVLSSRSPMLARVAELDLPDDIGVRFSPKSSIGRADIHARSLFDYHGLYDEVPRGGRGELWLDVNPQSFPTRFQAGNALGQLRFLRRLGSEEPSLNPEDVTWTYDENGKPLPNNFDDGGRLILSLYCPPNAIVGYEAVSPSKVDLDLSRRDFNPRHFFRELRSDPDGTVQLREGGFYIMALNEFIVCPPEWSTEVAPFDHRAGEMRGHYAGFIDSGFGYRPGDAKQGNRIVMEVRPFETRTVQNGQPFASVEIFENDGRPDRFYGQDNTNHYSRQSLPKLGKWWLDGVI